MPFENRRRTTRQRPTILTQTQSDARTIGLLNFPLDRSFDFPTANILSVVPLDRRPDTPIQVMLRHVLVVSSTNASTDIKTNQAALVGTSATVGRAQKLLPDKLPRSDAYMTTTVTIHDAVKAACGVLATFWAGRTLQNKDEEENGRGTCSWHKRGIIQ